MALYLISYDLESATGEEYTALIEYIKSIGNNGWEHPLKSTFMVITNLTAQQIHEGIRKVLTSKEGTLKTGTKWMVTPINLSQSQGWLSQKSVDWWKKAQGLGY